jgi:hypothetical protein
MTIIQFPNKFLITMFVAWLISHYSEGYLFSFSRTIFIVAGVIWSYEEIVHGVNWFRKILGIIIMVMIMTGIIMQSK